jgi:hypothetical protein
MSGLSVSENIRVLEENKKKLGEQIGVIQQELVRLDGSLRVFLNLRDLGVENIQIPQDEVTNREVTDTLD